MGTGAPTKSCISLGRILLISNRLLAIYLQRHQKAFVHAVYGPTDTLLYPGVDKLITSINLTGADPTFTFTSKKAILGDLRVTEDQFLDIGILVGFNYVQPFPPTVHEQVLKATVDMVKFYKSGHSAVSKKPRCSHQGSLIGDHRAHRPP
jgi:hypothetical protein